MRATIVAPDVQWGSTIVGCDFDCECKFITSPQTPYMEIELCKKHEKDNQDLETGKVTEIRIRSHVRLKNA